MKKIIIPIIFFFSLLAVSITYGYGQTDKSNVITLKDMSIVEKPQPAPAEVKAGLESIRIDDLGAYLKFLSSDLLEGRDTGEPGFDIAADFAATMFSLWGIQPAGDIPQPDRRSAFRQPPKPKPAEPTRSFFQEIEMKEVLKSKGQMVIQYRQGLLKKTKTFYPDIDYTYFARDTQTLTAPVVFVGYGITEKKLKFDEYKDINVEGKIVMMFTEAPGKDDPQSPFQQKELKEKYSPPRRRMRHRLSPKVKLAKEKGAAAILLVENAPEKNGDVGKRILDSRKVNDEKPIFPTERRRLSLIEPLPPMPWETLPSIRISRQTAAEILKLADFNLDELKGKIEKDLKSQSRELKGVSLTLENSVDTQLVRSRNVVGYIEGSDPELKKEVVVIGAHLDHLGKKGDYIFNGADDNGSGSVAVMEIAQAFAENKVKPKRSVLFALWTGEEVGLLGSRYYTLHPFSPLNKTVACLNLDMISHTWDKQRLKRMATMWHIKIDDEVMEKLDVSSFLSLSLSAEPNTLYDVLVDSNQYVGLSLYLRKSTRMMGGSDHAPFAMNHIPWVFFFASMTEDYHQPSDSFDKADLNFAQKITRLAYLTAFKLANQ